MSENMPVGALQQPDPGDVDGPVIHDLLIADLKTRAHPVSLLVEADVRDRLEFGLRKYGKPLRAHNGRNPVLDAYQEILDALVYFIQAMVETQVRSPADAERIAHLNEMYENGIAVAIELRESLSHD